MTSSQIPFRPTHHPLPREEQTQGAGAGANKPEIPSEISETAVDPQNTETINLDEKVLDMKVDILRKWKVVKEQTMTERPSLKKVIKDRRGREAITTANSAIIEIRRDINTPLTFSEINQIVYTTVSIITEQIAAKPKKRKVGEINQHEKQNSRKKSQESGVIYPS